MQCRNRFCTPLGKKLFLEAPIGQWLLCPCRFGENHHAKFVAHVMYCLEACFALIVRKVIFFKHPCRSTLLPTPVSQKPSCKKFGPCQMRCGDCFCQLSVRKVFLQAPLPNHFCAHVGFEQNHQAKNVAHAKCSMGTCFATVLPTAAFFKVSRHMPFGPALVWAPCSVNLYRKAI